MIVNHAKDDVQVHSRYDMGTLDVELSISRPSGSIGRVSSAPVRMTGEQAAKLAQTLDRLSAELVLGATHYNHAKPLPDYNWHGLKPQPDDDGHTFVESTYDPINGQLCATCPFRALEKHVPIYTQRYETLVFSAIVLGGLFVAGLAIHAGWSVAIWMWS